MNDSRMKHSGLDILKNVCKLNFVIVHDEVTWDSRFTINAK